MASSTDPGPADRVAADHVVDRVDHQAAVVNHKDAAASSTGSDPADRTAVDHVADRVDRPTGGVDHKDVVNTMRSKTRSVGFCFGLSQVFSAGC